MGQRRGRLRDDEKNFLDDVKGAASGIERRAGLLQRIIAVFIGDDRMRDEASQMVDEIGDTAHGLLEDTKTWEEKRKDERRRGERR